MTTVLKLACCWAVLGLYGFWMFRLGDARSGWSYHGALALPKNYRLSDSDSLNISGWADRKAYQGRYLRRAVGPNGSFTSADLAPAPEIAIGGAIPFPIPLKGRSAVAAALNAWSAVAIWDGAEPISDKAPVLALLCPKFESPASDCQAVVGVAKEAAGKLMKTDMAKITLFPVAP